MGLTRTTGQVSLDQDLAAIERRLKKLERPATAQIVNVVTTPVAAPSSILRAKTADGTVDIQGSALEVDQAVGLTLAQDGAYAKLGLGSLAISGVTNVVRVQKAAGSLYSRNAINLIEGANVTLTVADNPGSNRVDVTIASSGGGGGSLVIDELDGAPSATPTALHFPNGTLTDNGDGTMTYTPAGGGSSLTIAELDGSPSGTPTTLKFPNGTLTDAGGGVYTFALPSFANDPYAGGKPDNSIFSWVNQGGASVSATADSILLTANAAGGNNFRIREVTISGTPITITAAMRVSLIPTNYCYIGLCWRDSVSGKIAPVGLVYSSGLIWVADKWSSPTAFSASYTLSTGGMAGPQPFHNSGVIWLRVSDTGANRIFYVSNDGKTWLQLHTVGRTDYLTADRVGFFVNASQTSFDAATELLYWKQT